MRNGPVAGFLFAHGGRPARRLMFQEFAQEILLLMDSPVMTIDVDHPPLGAKELDAALLDAWGIVRNSSRLRILKIVHGYGSSGVGGTIRQEVRNWAFANRRRFKGVIEGEEYDLNRELTQTLRMDVGNFDDSDLSAGNAGITVIWVK